jgi:hypothetical protein
MILIHQEIMVPISQHLMSKSLRRMVRCLRVVPWDLPLEGHAVVLRNCNGFVLTGGRASLFVREKGFQVQTG